MGNEPDYYQLLGVEPMADQAAIDAAYQGRALRFRIGQLRDRARSLPGPSQEEIEQAYAVLGNAEARALYDAAYFPDKASARRRLPIWVWAVAAGWIAVIAVVCVLGARSRLADDGGAIGRFVGTETAAPSVVAAAVTETPTVATTVEVATNTPQQAVLPTIAPTPTVPPVPTPTPTAATPGLTFRPTETAPPAPSSAPSPTATVPAIVPTPPPTATTEPPPTPVPPPPTEPPPTEPPPPPPEPTPTPSFRATDRIGTSVPVNLRSGPGTGYGTLGSLRPGTLLAETGEEVRSGGYLWRRFRVADGRIGWVRDIDVLVVR